jgi:hypothetical protein
MAFPERPHFACEEHRGRTLLITRFVSDFAVSIDRAFDPADHGKIGKHGFTPVRGHPVDVVANRVSAGFR